jgi:hypothetical protein
VAAHAEQQHRPETPGGQIDALAWRGEQRGGIRQGAGDTAQVDPAPLEQADDAGREPTGEGVTPAGSLVNSLAMLRVSVSSETRGTHGGTCSRRSSLAQSMLRKKGCALISSAPR